MNEWLLILLLAVTEDNHTVTIGPMEGWTCGMAKSIIEGTQVYVDEDHARILDIRCVQVNSSADE